MLRVSKLTICCFLLVFSSIAQIHESLLRDTRHEYITPYFALIYKDQLSSTALLFPNYLAVDRKSFITVGKKDGSELDNLYFTSQRTKQMVTRGIHLDNFSINTDHSERKDDEVNDLYYRSSNSNNWKLSTGVWQLGKFESTHGGVSVNVDLNKSNTKRTEEDSSYTREITDNFFSVNAQVVATVAIRPNGFLRIEYDKEVNNTDYELSFRQQSYTFPENDSRKKSKTMTFSLGYFCTREKGTGSFSLNIGHKQLINSLSSGLHDDDSEGGCFESVLSKKFTMDNFDIYLGGAVYGNAMFFTKELESISLIDRFSHFSKDNSNITISGSVPIFIDYTPCKPITFYCFFKPLIRYSRYSKTAVLRNESNTQTMISDNSLGMVLHYKNCDLNLKPIIYQGIRLSSVEIRYMF